MADLAFPIDTNDAVRCLMDGSYEDGLAADTIHVNARASFQFVKVNVAKLCYQISNTKFLTDLFSTEKQVLIKS